MKITIKASQYQDREFVQISELDAWADGDDGWYVNNVYKGDIYEVPYDVTDADLLRIINTVYPSIKMDDIVIDWYNDIDGVIEVLDSDNGAPVISFEFIDPDNIEFEAKHGTRVYDLNGRQLTMYKDGTSEWV